jgi:hypothetical protein
MGGWKLEVFRMTCYVSLPIVCFYLFNKPEYFKELLIRDRRFYFSNEDPESVLLEFFITPFFIVELTLRFFKAQSDRRIQKEERKRYRSETPSRNRCPQVKKIRKNTFFNFFILLLFIFLYTLIIQLIK